jgi:hypothetical protein
MERQNATKPADRVRRDRSWLLKIGEQLGGQFDFQNATNTIVLQVKNLAALAASIDPATVAGLAFLFIGGPLT